MEYELKELLRKLSLRIGNPNRIFTDGEKMFMGKYAKFLNNDVKGLLNKYKLPIENCGINGVAMKHLFDWMLRGLYDRKALRTIVEKSFAWQRDQLNNQR